MSDWGSGRIRKGHIFTLDPATKEKLEVFSRDTGFAMSVIVEAAINRFIDEEREAMKK